MTSFAFITGSSKGIGKDLANLLLEKDFVVHGFSRSNSLKHYNFHHHKTDLANINKINSISFPKIDNVKEIYLINNAGEIGNITKIGNKASNNIVNEVNINITAPILLSNLFIKTYKSIQSRLTIINISSGAALRPIHSWGTYCISKSGIDMLTKIINEEYADIRALSIYPGIVNTEMQEKIRNASDKEFPLKQKFIDYFKNNELSDCKTVAEKIFYIMSNLSQFEQNHISLRDF